MAAFTPTHALVRSRTFAHPTPSEHAHKPIHSLDDTEVALRKNQLKKRLVDLTQSDNALNQSAQRHLRFDRTVNFEGASGALYSQIRKTDLAQFKGAVEIVAQYGLTFAAPDRPTKDHLKQLTMANDLESDYLRDRPSFDYQDACDAVYKSAVGQRRKPVLFVNSRHAAGQILEHFRGTKDIAGTPEQHIEKHLKPLKNSMYALEFQHQASVGAARKLVDVYGARPSAFSVTSTDQTQNFTPNPNINNQKLLESFQSVSHNISDRLRAIPDDIGPAKLAHAAADLVDQLIDVFDAKETMDAHNQNPILANSLSTMKNIADSLPELCHDSRKFNTAYQALIEELQVSLSTTKPYNSEDFHQVSKQLLTSDCLPSTVPTPPVHLVSSGMGALALGFEIAEQLTGKANIEELSSKKHGTSPVYYEVDQLRYHRMVESDNADTVYATLNHSTPRKNGDSPWGIDALSSSLSQKLAQRDLKDTSNQPLYCILDATLEKRGDIDTLCQRFGDEVAQNKLKIIVCKSYQKYANLGSAKVMAGGIGMISANDSDNKLVNQYLNDIEKDLNLIDNNDAQLLVHMLGCREHEFNLLDRAVENSAFSANNLFSGQNEHQAFDYNEAHLPFGALIQESQPHSLSLHLEAGSKNIPLSRSSHFSDLYTPSRDSFGFNQTTRTMTPIDNQVATRLSFGQESQSELVEQLYAPSLLMKKDRQQWSCDQAQTLIHSIANDAIKSVRIPSHVKPALWQKLHVAAQLEKPKVGDSERLNSSLDSQHLKPLLNGARGYTLNKITSVMNHLGELIMHSTKPEQWTIGKDRPIVDELLSGLIQSGLPGVSSSGRSGVLALQAHMSMADMKSTSKNQQLRGLQSLTSAIQRLPGWSGIPQQLLTIPDGVFQQAALPQKEATLSVMFSTLDNTTQLDLMQRLIDKGDLNKATACLERFEKHEHTPPENFHSTSGSDIQTINDTEQNRMDSKLRQLRMDLGYTN
ncbi:hypothetical protein [Marinomonas balearica]|uniref:Uncharacterized protein n=1 Tax=Marinomonas balearica TaxID=491947 RepID=A0A4R6M3C5_9GAMM|nr:hypothetical protein [Marinomonas balearica]TDO95771.1 hypothetical protein DFP79_3126 [Marinomonas balearica]